MVVSPKEDPKTDSQNTYTPYYRDPEKGTPHSEKVSYYGISSHLWVRASGFGSLNIQGLAFKV